MHILYDYLEKICSPNPETMSDDVQRKLQSQRNKSFLIMQTIVAVIMTLYTIFVKKSPTLANYVFIYMCYGLTILFCVTCRTYISYFKFFYAVLLTFMCPIAVYFDGEGVFGGWIAVHVFPLLLLYYYGSRFLCFLEMCVQLVFLHAIYKSQMLECLNATTSQQYVHRLTNITTFTVIVNTVMVYTIDLSLQKIYTHELLIGEHKRRELETQKTFILSFSHELRNLINAVAGNIQLSLLEKLPAKVHSCLENAETGASLLLQLINNILDRGNMEVGELEINATAGTVHQTLEKMWSICSYLLKEKGLKGQLRISKNIPQVLKLDHDRLMQILLNLIWNAAKFTQQGSVNIKIDWVMNSPITEASFYPQPFDDENEGIYEKDHAFSLLNDSIRLINLEKKKWNPQEYSNLIESGPGLLKITVVDTGCGIPPNKLPKIFQKLHNIEREKGPIKLGTSLGLFITKELCTRMGGDIRVSSKVDKGTAFIVCIPAEPVFLEELTTIMGIESLVSLTREQEIKAMIVDDLNFNIVVLGNYLERMKIEVAETAKDGHEALRKYIQAVKMRKPFDLVTMDVEMPGMDGKTAVQKIREYERENHLRPCLIIMISGNCSRSEINHCLRKDGLILADAFLKKPATFEELFREVSKHFSAKMASSLRDHSL